VQMSEPSKRLEEKNATNPPYLACQLSMFSALVKYMVVKITHSSSEVILRTMKHTVIYPGSDPS
jgi:hypothetical protein